MRRFPHKTELLAFPRNVVDPRGQNWGVSVEPWWPGTVEQLELCTLGIDLALRIFSF